MGPQQEYGSIRIFRDNNVLLEEWDKNMKKQENPDSKASGVYAHPINIIPTMVYELSLALTKLDLRIWDTFYWLGG